MLLYMQIASTLRMTIGQFLSATTAEDLAYYQGRYRVDGIPELGIAPPEHRGVMTQDQLVQKFRDINKIMGVKDGN